VNCGGVEPVGDGVGGAGARCAGGDLTRCHGPVC
jgi:hypothetical protein